MDPGSYLTFKAKIARKTLNDGNTKNVEIVVLFKYLNNFWRTLEMPLINCEMNLMPTWRADCVISSATGATTFTIIKKKKLNSSSNSVK